MAQVEDCIADAIGTIRHFVRETAGKEPTSEQIARALKRYFVLNEIKEHILLEFENDGENNHD